MAQDVERNGCFADDADNGCTCSARSANDCVCGYDDSNPLHLDAFNAGVIAAADKLLRTIQGKDYGGGVMGCPSLEEVRRWIIANRQPS